MDDVARTAVDCLTVGDVDDALRLLAARRGGLVLARECPAHGVSRAAVRWAAGSGRLVVIGPGAWVDADVWAATDARARHLLRLRAALDRCPGSVAAGWSAAVVWGLPLPGPPPARPVVLRPRTAARPERGSRSGAVVVRRAWLAPGEVTRHRGLPVTDPARTYLDVARGCDLPWCLAVADAVRRRHGLSREQLVEAVDRHPSAAGHARSRRAAELSEHLVESPLESLARGVQVQLGLPVPEVQVWVGRSEPELRVDMLVRRYAVVVEADGRLKYEGPSSRPGQAWADKRRTDRLLDLGYDCHRFVAADAHRPLAWGRELVSTFARSARRVGLPSPPPDLRLTA